MEVKTRDSGRRCIDQLRRTHGAENVTPWNIKYRGAQLVLDLVDRKGKYENDFMHGPVPAWRDRGTWRPARIQFTANAIRPLDRPAGKWVE